MPAITCYLSKSVLSALEVERQKRRLDSKPQAIKAIVTEYFREKRMLNEEKD